MEFKENLAAVLHEPGSIQIHQRPVPAPGEGEVLLEVQSVGVCGSDVHYFEDGRIGDFVVRDPLVLGHEASGRVIGHGPNVHGLEEGALVAIEPGIPCRRCGQCRSGRYNLCPGIRFLATPPVDGAFTGYLAMPADFCYPVPEGLGADAAALIEPLSVGVWACQKAGVGPGDQVLVTGAGPVGLLTALAARACGATVTVCDINEHRLRRAASAGVHQAVDLNRTAITALGPFGAFIECTGADRVAGEGLATLEPAGTAVLVGTSPRKDLHLDLSVLQTRELHVTAAFRYANSYPAAIWLAASGAVPLGQIVDAVFPLEATADALQAVRRDPSLMKVIVRPGG